MDKQMARKLAQLNTGFYAQQAASFSSTRKSPWPGWRTVAQLLESELLDGCAGAGEATARPNAEPVRLLDVACGNLRFERFLLQDCSWFNWEFVAADNCPALIKGAALPQDRVQLACVDAVEALIDGTLSGQLTALAPGPFDVAVSFGFAHHVPGFAGRVNLLRALLSTVRPGGLVAVSLWRFMDDPGLAEKARRSTEQALAQLSWLQAECLEAGDYVLGWQDRPGAFRYCHHFDSAEISQLLQAVPEARLVARFRADGRTGGLNQYLVLRHVG